jgi:hypothetical protein
VLVGRRSAEAASAWSHDVLAGQGGAADARHACRLGASHEKRIQGCIARGSGAMPRSCGGVGVTSGQC